MDSHSKDKMVMKPSFLYGDSYTGNNTSFYYDGTKIQSLFFIYGWANSQPMTEDVTYVMSPLIGYDHIQWQIENKPWGPSQ